MGGLVELGILVMRTSSDRGHVMESRINAQSDFAF